jgi:hypothetical protein
MIQAGIRGNPLPIITTNQSEVHFGENAGFADATFS